MPETVTDSMAVPGRRGDADATPAFTAREPSAGAAG
jgi:hypothetical protein